MTVGLERSSAVSTSALTQTDVAALEKMYALRGRYGVLGFIEQYPFLMPTLLEAPARIKSYFPYSRLILEVFVDAEIAGWVQLVLHIGTTLSVGEEQPLLEKVWDEWLFNLSDQVAAIFSADVEYVGEGYELDETQSEVESAATE